MSEIDGKFSVEVRHNNVVYECWLEKKNYNIFKMPAFAISVVVGVLPGAQGYVPQQNSVIICKDCWEKNLGDGNGLELREPSKIILTDHLPKKLKN